MIMKIHRTKKAGNYLLLPAFFSYIFSYTFYTFYTFSLSFDYQ